jgi:hypothetical protein
MSTAIIQYKTADGAIFHTKEQAAKHEEVMEQVRLALLPLGDRPSDDLLRKGWVQHSEKAVRIAHCSLVKLALPLIEYLPWLRDLALTDPFSIHPCSIIGRSSVWVIARARAAH